MGGTCCMACNVRQNMVGPGEVDDELERETSGECERFGPVRRCLIFEIKVRIRPRMYDVWYCCCVVVVAYWAT